MICTTCLVPSLSMNDLNFLIFYSSGSGGSPLTEMEDFLIAGGGFSGDDCSLF